MVSFTPSNKIASLDQTTTNQVPTKFPQRNNTGDKVQKLPNGRKIPVWLRSLLIMQQSSSFITFFLVVFSLGIYACTVYAQKQWSQEYRQLQKLQRHERQLTATNEMLKNQAAKDAQRSESGLIKPDVSLPIFLHPAPQRQSLSRPPVNSPLDSSKLPIAY